MKASMIKYIIYVLPAFVFLVSCSINRPKTIDIPTPDSFIEDTVDSSKIPETGRWWKFFNDKRLNGLMEEAFSKNLDIAQAYAHLDQLQAVYKSTKAAEAPFLDINAQASRDSQPGISGSTVGNNYSLSLAAGYEIDVWKRFKNRSKAAALEKEASKEDIESLFITLSAQVADLYYLAVEQRAQLKLADETINSFQETLARVEERYREGLVSVLDVYQARQNLASAKASRPAFEAGLAVAEHGLSVLIGRFPEKNISGALRDIPPAQKAFPAGIPSQVLAMRPDIQKEILQLKASDARVAAAIADRFPSFNLLGGYGASQTALSTGDISGTFWNIIIKLAQPVLNGGRLRAEVGRAKAVYMEHLAGYHKSVLNAIKEVEDALARSRSTEENIRYLKEQVDVTDNALRLSVERYMQGLSDYIPVLTSQNLHFEAQKRLLSARRQLISNRISLARALGGRWMKDEFIEHLENTKKED